jgi:hypothetical protein
MRLGVEQSETVSLVGPLALVAGGAALDRLVATRRRCARKQIGEEPIERVVAVVGQPGRLPCQRAVRVALAGRKLPQMVDDGREIAARHGPGERGTRAEPERVQQARFGEGCEGFEGNAGRSRESLDLAQQRDEVVRSDHGGRVIPRSGSVNVRSSSASASSCTCGSPAIAAHEPGRRSSPMLTDGSDWRGCSAPTLTSGRISRSDSKTPTPNEPAR